MIRVGVLRGGPGNHYDESLATGAYLLQHLPRDRYEVLDIFLDTDGAWHLGGLPLGPERLKMRTDVVWNALHGFYGEDGKVQQLLEAHGIPYTGSGALSSAIAMNKKLFKGHMAQLGIKTPRGVYIEEWGDGDREKTVADVVRTISTKFSPPWFVEPISRSHINRGTRVITRDELTAVLLRMFDLRIPVVVEEMVLGKEWSVITAPGFRGDSQYTFLPMRNGDSRAKVQPKDSAELQRIAREIHTGLNFGQYSRIKFVLTPKGHIHVLSAETMPALHEGSDLHQSLEAVGSSFEEFAQHIIDSAL